MWPFSNSKYVPIETGTDSVSEQSSGFESGFAPKTNSVGVRIQLSWAFWTHILLFIANAWIFVASLLYYHQQHLLYEQNTNEYNVSYHRPDLNGALKSISSFCMTISHSISIHIAYIGGFLAPVLDSLDLRPTLQTFNGALRDNSSIWRQPPSAEVDAAWNYISAEGLEVITVSSSALLQSGKNASECVKAPVSWGEGTDAYIAQVDVFHQIHCLNELRKEIFYDHYYESPPDELHRAHKAHCIHMLLQTLMCTADVGIISHNWVHNEKIREPKTRPMPDFNMVKFCRDFDALLDWAREKGVKDLPRKWRQLKYTEGTKIVPGEGYA